MSSVEAYARARQLIDEAHKQDPLYKARTGGEESGGERTINAKVKVDDESTPEDEAKQDEMAYADAMEKWIITLINSTPESSSKVKEITGEREILRLAARCQHLQRFLNPRSSYPEGKAGYLKWRRDLYTIQANRAKDFMEQAGITQEERDNVGIWVSKTDLKPGKEGGLWGTQLLEDSAVLVFLQDQLQHFAANHEKYTRDKFVDIIKKTWRKLSNDGKEAAKGLDMPDGLKGIIAEATQDTADSKIS